jgi:hypothetical protein
MTFVKDVMCMISRFQIFTWTMSIPKKHSSLTKICKFIISSFHQFSHDEALRSIAEEIYNFSSLGPSGDQYLVVLVDLLARRNL